MKLLVVLSAVMACTFAKPSIGYSSLGYAGLLSPALASSGIIASHGVVAPGLVNRAYAAPLLANYGSAPLVASSYAAASLVPSSYSIASVVPSSYAAAPAIVAAPSSVVAAAPAIAAHSAVVSAPATVAVAAPVTKTQYHSQDELGNAAFGHSEPGQVHNAVQDAQGNRVGSFSYLNPTDGQVHRTDYVADSLGYRVAANDLPLGPAAPIAETPEVAAARAAHIAAHSRARRSLLTTPASTAPLATPLVYASPAVLPAPLSYAAPVAAPAVLPAPLSYAAPVAAPIVARPYAAQLGLPATLTTIVNNPGHAVSYRID